MAPGRRLLVRAQNHMDPGNIAARDLRRMRAPDGKRLDIVFHVSNDGVAFRNVFPDTSVEVRRIVEEVTSYRGAIGGSPRGPEP